MSVLKIYNDITTEADKKAAQFWGDAEGVCFKDIDSFIESMPKADKTIDIRLHCDGGSCLEGWAIYDRLRATGFEISATVEGNAASMATVILMAAPKERRRAYRSAQICVHNPWICPWALGDAVNADDLQKYADDLRREQNKMVDLYVDRCGCDRDEIQALMNEDKYIDVDEALSLGIIGEIIEPASAKKKTITIGSTHNNKNSKAMTKTSKDKDGKVEVKQSWLDKVLAKFGKKSIEEVTFGMDLNTADGQTLTVERDEGEPQVGDTASPDGEFTMPDGKTIVVKDGVITEIKPAEQGSDDDNTNEPANDDLQKQVDDLTAENNKLKDEVAELQQKLADAQSKKKDDLRILNAVKMAGGEQALAKLASTYKPSGRKVSGKNVSAASGDREEISAMRAEIEARRAGTFKPADKTAKSNK